jgi:predicted dehydrogenase
MSVRSRDAFRAPAGSGERLVEVAEDDNWHLVLDLGQVLGSVVVDFCAQPSPSHHLEVLGERGSIAIDLLDVAAPASIFRPETGWREEPLWHDRAAGPDHVLGVWAFAARVVGRDAPLPDPETAVRVLAALEAARRSADELRAVSVAEPVAAPGEDLR